MDFVTAFRLRAELHPLVIPAQAGIQESLSVSLALVDENAAHTLF